MRWRPLRMMVATIGLAPSAAVAREVQPWPTLFISAPVGDGILASGEVINRVSPDDDRPSQLEMRFQLGHPVSKRLSLWVGYVHVATYQSGRNGIENQAVEQASWDMGAIGPVRFASRTRLEQRFIRDVGETSWRLREQLRAALPLAAGGPSAVLWAEPYLALNRTAAQQRTFDQLRLFGGVTFPVTRHADFELGYLRQHLHRPAGDIDNDVVPVILNLRF